MRSTEDRCQQVDVEHLREKLLANCKPLPEAVRARYDALRGALLQQRKEAFELAREREEQYASKKNMTCLPKLSPFFQQFLEGKPKRREYSNSCEMGSYQLAHTPEKCLFYSGQSKCTTATQDTDLECFSSEVGQAEEGHGDVDESDEEDRSSDISGGDGDPVGSLDDCDFPLSPTELQFRQHGDGVTPHQVAYHFVPEPLVLHVGGMGPIGCVEFAPTVSSENGACDLAAGTASGKVLLFCVTDGRVLSSSVLEGHSAAVTDLSWSQTGQFLLTASLDTYVIVWNVRSKQKEFKVRQIPVQHQPLVARFLPNNNNIFVVGMRTPSLRVFNLSTGMLLKRVKCKYAVGAITTDTKGVYVFIGDARGNITMYISNLESGVVQRESELTIAKDRPVTSLCWKWLTSEAARGDTSNTNRQDLPPPQCLLANVRADVIALVRVDSSLSITGNVQFSLSLMRTLSFPLHNHNIRSVLCPDHGADASSGIMSFACGAEDGTVRIILVGAQRSNELSCLKFPLSLAMSSGDSLATEHSPGSASARSLSNQPAIVDVSWSADAMELAAGTSAGHLLLWKRLKISGEDESGGFLFKLGNSKREQGSQSETTVSGTETTS